MQDTIQPYSSYPLWIRLICGKGWFSVSRKELVKIEIVALCFSLFGGSIWLASLLFSLPETLIPFFNIKFTDFFGLGGLGCLLMAYRYSLTIRVGDKYQVWSPLAQTRS